MVINGFRYGISYLPANCIAYLNGYRYGAYKEDINDRDNIHITEWFKTREEIQAFVNEHPEYGKERA